MSVRMLDRQTSTETPRIDYQLQYSVSLHLLQLELLLRVFWLVYSQKATSHQWGVRTPVKKSGQTQRVRRRVFSKVTVLCDFQSDCVSEFVRKRLRVHSLHLQVEGLSLKSRRARGGVLLLR